MVIKLHYLMGRNGSENLWGTDSERVPIGPCLLVFVPSSNPHLSVGHASKE